MKPDARRGGLLASFACLFMCLAFARTLKAQCPDAVTKVPASGGYVKNCHGLRVIVFMHGLGSSPEAWRNLETKAYWPYLIATDPSRVYKDTDVYVAGYDTPRGGGVMTMKDLTIQIMNRLKYDRVFADHSEVIFIAHSLGGLLTQQLLLTYRGPDVAQKVHILFLYGSPQEGSPVANWAKLFKPDPLIKELQTGDGNFILQAMDVDWIQSGFNIKRYCAYEKLRQLGAKVVPTDSATRGCNDTLPMNTNHHHLVEPANREADGYIFVTNHLDNTPPRPPLAGPVSTSGGKPDTPPAPISVPPASQPCTYGAGDNLYHDVESCMSEIQKIENDYSIQIQNIVDAAQKMHFGPAAEKLTPSDANTIYRDDRETDKTYSTWRTKFEPKRAKALSCIQQQLNPSQQQVDQDVRNYSDADKAASTMSEYSSLQNKEFDDKRFAAMSAYVSDLTNRLYKISCK